MSWSTVIALVSTMFEATAVIKRPKIGRDSTQGVSQGTFTVIAKDIPCSCQQASSQVRDLYAQRNIMAGTTIYFDRDYGAEVNDRIEVTDRIAMSSGLAQDVFSYNVVGKQQPVGRGRLWSVDAELIRAPMIRV